MADPLDEFLRPPGEAPAVWCAFDADWYLAADPAAAAAVAAEEPDDAEARWRAARDHYLAHGQADGRSPTMFFDEAWYRATVPGVADGVAAGRWRSGFEHYCLDGDADASPHWLFDAALYRAVNPDLTDDAVRAGGNFNRYDHWLRDGARHGRIAHQLFDAATCRAAAGETLASSGACPFQHYLAALGRGGPERVTTPYFDPAWYRAAYPEVDAAIRAGAVRGALHHYLTWGAAAGFDPLPDFVEAHYRTVNRDIDAAVAAGVFRCGYEHFVLQGARAGRSPAPWIDLRWYATTHATVRAALADGSARDAFQYLLGPGRALGLATAPSEGLGRALLPLHLRTRPTFGGGTPVLSVALALPADLGRALQTIAALRAALSGSVELLLLDGGNGLGARVAAQVPGAVALPIAAGASRAQARNQALAACTAPLLLLLDGAVELPPGGLVPALRRMDQDASLGAVGGRVVGADGRLREAGGTVCNDGALHFCRRGAAVTVREASFARDVDFCSATALLLRRNLVRALDGFAEDVADGPTADADLCLRIWQAGWRVGFEPALVTVCGDARALRLEPAIVDAAALAARHPEYIARRPAPDAAADAPPPTEPAGTALVIAESLAAIAGDGALLRSIAEWQRDGMAVSVWPLDGGDDAVATLALADGVAIVADMDTAAVGGFTQVRYATEALRERLTAPPPVEAPAETPPSSRRIGSRRMLRGHRPA